MDRYLSIPINTSFIHFGQYIHREKYVLNHQDLACHMLPSNFPDKSHMLPVDENEQCVNL